MLCIPSVWSTSVFALEFILGYLIVDLCFFPSAEYCSSSVYDKVAACVLSMSTRWNLQMHTYLWLVAIPLPSCPGPHVLLPTRSLRFRVSVSGKNIVSAVCKCLETRHQDIRYRRDLSSWQFRTEHPFHSHRFPPYPLWPPRHPLVVRAAAFAIASHRPPEHAVSFENCGKSCLYD